MSKVQFYSPCNQHLLPAAHSPRAHSLLPGGKPEELERKRLGRTETGAGSGRNLLSPFENWSTISRQMTLGTAVEPQLPWAPSLSDTVIKWPGLEKCYETQKNSVSSHWIITLLLTSLGLVLSPSTLALEMKATRGIRGWGCWLVECSLTQPKG